MHGAVRGAGGVARARLAVYGKGRRRNGYGGVCTKARHARRRGGGPGWDLEPWRAAGRSMTWTVERSFVRIERQRSLLYGSGRGRNVLKPNSAWTSYRRGCRCNCRAAVKLSQARTRRIRTALARRPRAARGPGGTSSTPSTRTKPLMGARSRASGDCSLTLHDKVLWEATVPVAAAKRCAVRHRRGRRRCSRYRCLAGLVYVRMRVVWCTWSEAL